MLFNRKTTSQAFTALLLALLLSLSAAAAVFAQQRAVDLTRKGSISVTLKESEAPHKVVTGSAFQLYQVASLDADLQYTFTQGFAGSGVSLDDLQASDLATHLYAHAQQKKLKAVVEQADSKGEVSFEGLDLGLYLVVQKGTVSGYYATSPFLVSLPMADPDGGWLYEVSASPKVETKPSKPYNPPYIPPNNPPETPPEAPSYTQLSVKKVWAGSGAEKPQSVTAALLCDGVILETAELNDSNGWSYAWVNLSTQYQWSITEVGVPAGYTVSYSLAGDQVTITNTYIPTVEIKDENEELTVTKVWEDGEGEVRPRTITVELYNGSALCGSVQLSADNNWTYTWKNLPKTGTYHVQEVGIPADYQVSYSVKGTAITITNTYLVEFPDNPSPTGPGELIQTGQLSWPIPVLAGLGILLFMAGWAMVFFRKDSNRE